MKKHLLALVLFFTVFVIKAENEPNDNTGTANTIAVNSTDNGAVSNSDIGDWWKVTIPVDGRLTVNITNPTNGQFYIRLYDVNGTTELTNVFRYSDGSGSTLMFNLQPNTYFIKIEWYSGTGDYTLNPSLTPATYTNDAENNDLQANAASINPGDSLTGHLAYHTNGVTDYTDWWKITTTVDGRLTINPGNENTMQFYARLYDTDGVTELTYMFRYSDGSGGVANYSLEPGTYYIKIEWYSGYGSYSLRLPYVPAAYTNDLGNNNLSANASTIAPADSLTGHLGYHSSGLTDVTDWWKITTTVDGRLTVNPGNENTMQFYARLYDADGTTELTNMFRYNDGSGGTMSYSLMPGTYFIKIEWYSGYGSYSLRTPFVPATLTNDTENNDFAIDAHTIAHDDSLPGHLGYHTNGWTDLKDWWQVTITDNGRLTIDPTTETTLQFYVRLFAADSVTELTSIFRYFDGSGGVLNYNVAPGTYFIKVDWYSGYGSYSLRTDFIPAPTANFGYTGYINNFSFTDSSLDATSYLWNFGDGVTSTLVNPQHTYAEPGAYNVCLIASNLVGVDTFCVYVNVKGIKNVHVNHAGNTGDATIYVYGGGFTTNTTFKLTRSGYPDIVGDTTIIPSIGAIRSTFDLRNQSVGLWNVVVTIPGDTVMTVVNGFTIEAGVAADPWVDIVGRDRILFNRTQTYDIVYGNNGNVDASGVQLWLVVSREQGIDIDFQGFVVDLPQAAIDSGWTDIADSIPVYFDTDSLFGEPFNARVYGFYIPIIPAGQTERVKMTIRTDEDVKVMAWVNPPLYQSPLSQDYKTCVALAVGKLVSSGIGLVNPMAGCMNSAIPTYVYDPWAYKNPEPAQPKSWGSSLWNLSTTFLNCVGAFTPLGQVYNVAVNLTGFAADFSSAWESAEACRDAYGQKSRKDKNIRAVSSFDPNEIIGPAGYTPANYSLKNDEYAYTIFFENLSTATAPAQEVFVTDTLDTDIFDISNFSFGPVTFGDTIIFPLSDEKQFTADVDMRPSQDIIVRIEGTLDTVNAIIHWHLITFDPATMALTEDPDGGFLPPNVTSPEGEGSVSFSVGLKPTLTHGTEIRNEATIVFDLNPPIYTNEWLNTLDLVKPQSSVEPLSAVVNDTLFQVEWSGSDNGSGVRNYTIFVSENDSDYVAWKSYTSATSDYFDGEYGSTYKFYSIAHDSLGHIEDEPSGHDAMTEVLVSVEENELNPNSLSIFPNPATHETMVTFELAVPEKALLKITDVTGREIKTLMNESLSAGKHQVRININDFSAGTYFVNLQAGNYSTTKRFSVIR